LFRALWRRFEKEADFEGVAGLASSGLGQRIKRDWREAVAFEVLMAFSLRFVNSRLTILEGPLTQINAGSLQNV